MVFRFAVAAYCFWDASVRRMKNPWLWSVSGAILGLFALAILHGNRWLKPGETRTGGRALDSCRWIAILNTIKFLILIFQALLSYSRFLSKYPGGGIIGRLTLEGVSMTIGRLILAWLVTTGGVLVLGLILKKDIREQGPTGPLA